MAVVRHPVLGVHGCERWRQRSDPFRVLVEFPDAHGGFDGINWLCQ